MIDLHCGDCLEVMRGMADDSVDLVFTSPPYADARLYGELEFKIKGQDWVGWALPRYLECVRVCKGLVCWVVQGQTRQFRWSATPALLMADLHRAGVKLRDPSFFWRVGIPGSGGPDDWRHDVEFVVRSSKGKLPWSDNCATGHPPKCPPGGAPSHHSRDGRVKDAVYRAPKKANPGNVVHCVVGGGKMGSKWAGANEAPFPESLVEPFIRCFAKPGGTVLDCFCGSGTTCAVAQRLGRKYIGIDMRQSQIDLTKRRLAEQRVL